MFKKILSLVLALFLSFGSCTEVFAQTSLDNIKLLITKPEKYVKKKENILSMAVLAGMTSYDEVIKSFIALKEKIAAKELQLAQIQNARVLNAGKDVYYTLKSGSYSYKLNFPALDNKYRWQKANVYEPALAKIKESRWTYFQYYKSPEVEAAWSAAEKEFAEVEKEFRALERQWRSARSSLLKGAASAEETALKKELAVLRRELTSKHTAFSDAQYQVFKKEYSSLIAALRNKAGLFLPEELDKFVARMDAELMRLQKASTPEEIAFARRALNEALSKFSNLSVGANAKEIKFYKESLGKFFKNVSSRLSLKSSVPLLSAGALLIFMFSAQSAQAAEVKVSNKRAAVSRTLDYAYKQTPSLMLANVLALSNTCGADLVASIIYDKQEYLPLVEKQTENLKFIAQAEQIEPDLLADIIISSDDFEKVNPQAFIF